MANARTRARWIGVGLVATIVAAACEIPTAAPYWKTKWEVPAESTTIAVTNFLPAGVTLAAGGGALLVAVPTPAPVTTSLGTICGAPCSATATVPIPAFSNAGSPIGGALSIPAAVASAVIASGAIDIVVTNNFTFDPLRPAGTAVRGSMRILLTAGAATVADTTIGGATSSLAAGGATTFRVFLRPGAISGASLSYQASVTCPGSTTTTVINPAHTIVIGPSIVAPGISVSSASVQLSAFAVNDSSAAFDLSGVQIDTANIQDASIAMRITNPFTAAATFGLTLSSPGVAPASHALSIPAAPNAVTPSVSTAEIVFTTAEFRRFFGHSNVRLKFGGTVTGTGPGSTVNVTPTAKLGIQSSLRTSILVGNR